MLDMSRVPGPYHDNISPNDTPMMDAIKYIHSGESSIIF